MFPVKFAKVSGYDGGEFMSGFVVGRVAGGRIFRRRLQPLRGCRDRSFRRDSRFQCNTAIG